MLQRLRAKTFLSAVALSALVAAVPMALSPNLVRAQVSAQSMPNVADLAEKLLPAVVEISIESKVADGSSPDMPKIPDDSPFKDFFDQFLKKKQQQDGQGGGAKPNDQGGNDAPRPNPDERTVNSMGSGFIIDSTGLIVTNNHVVEGANSIQVHMQDGTMMKAE
ncbi:MAG: serine protease, partial [Alphaproteobacteria bacterium]|nr:serine protease [Alphaproteobacteria bacterium]